MLKELEEKQTIEGIGASVQITPLNTITLAIEEYTRLKDIETRFAIMREEMLKAAYCPIHHQIILGIEKEYKQAQEIKADLLPQKE